MTSWTTCDEIAKTVCVVLVMESSVIPNLISHSQSPHCLNPFACSITVRSGDTWVCILGPVGSVFVMNFVLFRFCNLPAAFRGKVGTL